MNAHILLLLMATVIWGYGFVAAKFALDVYDPYWVNALRFSLAGGLSLPFLLWRKSFWRKKHILKEAFIGSIFLFGILIFQTIGLTKTSVAKSGFITTLYALLIPIISMIIFKTKFKRSFWMLIVLAMLGVAMMCDFEVNDLNTGDFLTFLCAISGAFHIIYIGKVANKIDSAVEFNFLQNFFTGIISLVTAFIVVGPVDITGLLTTNTKALEGLLFLGIISSMISFTAQVIAQKKIPDHIAGLIFLTESPFAALFGFLVLGETVSKLGLVGAGLIVTSVILVPILGRQVTAKVKV